MALTRGIQLLPASRATTYSDARTGLGAACFGETPDGLSAIGGALVLFGAWLAGRSGAAA